MCVKTSNDIHFKIEEAAKNTSCSITRYFKDEFLSNTPDIWIDDVPVAIIWSWLNSNYLGIKHPFRSFHYQLIYEIDIYSQTIFAMPFFRTPIAYNKFYLSLSLGCQVTLQNLKLRQGIFSAVPSFLTVERIENW